MRERIAICQGYVYSDSAEMIAYIYSVDMSAYVCSDVINYVCRNYIEGIACINSVE